MCYLIKDAFFMCLCGYEHCDYCRKNAFKPAFAGYVFLLQYLPISIIIRREKKSKGVMTF